MIMPVRVGFKTDNKEGSWNIITPQNLKIFGIQDASGCITPSVCFSVPGRLYPENGVASEIHPCAGSICAEFSHNGNKYAIHDIFYHDTKPAPRHNGGKPHWNIERRFVKNDVEFKRTGDVVVNHIIPDSPSIVIEVTKTDGTVEKKEVFRP